MTQYLVIPQMTKKKSDPEDLTWSRRIDFNMAVVCESEEELVQLKQQYRDGYPHAQNMFIGFVVITCEKIEWDLPDELSAVES